MSSGTLTPANQITILRLIFVPIFVILVVGGHNAGALAVFGAAAASDVLDGFVARHFRQVTPLGVALDPIADKVLLSAAFLTLSFRAALPWWLTIMVLSRDAGILLVALLIILVSGYRPFPPTILGKASTVVQVITVFEALSLAAGMPWSSVPAVRAFIYLTAVFVVISAIHYFITSRHSHPRHPDEVHSSMTPFR